MEEDKRMEFYRHFSRQSSSKYDEQKELPEEGITGGKRKSEKKQQRSQRKQNSPTMITRQQSTWSTAIGLVIPWVVIGFTIFKGTSREHIEHLCLTSGIISFFVLIARPGESSVIEVFDNVD